MNSLPEDPMEQGQEGGARLRVEARMDRCICGCGIKVLSLSAKDLFAHEASVCHAKFHLRLVGSLRQNYSLQNQIIENA